MARAHGSWDGVGSLPFILPEVVARYAFPPSLVRARASPYGRLREDLQFLFAYFFAHSLGTGGGTVTRARASGVLNVLLMMDAGWYFTHELISSLVGMSRSSEPYTSIDK